MATACGGNAGSGATTPPDTTGELDIVLFGDTGPNATPVDATAPVVADAAATCPGGPGCPCTASADCNNAL